MSIIRHNGQFVCTNKKVINKMAVDNLLFHYYSDSCMICVDWVQAGKSFINSGV